MNLNDSRRFCVAWERPEALASGCLHFSVFGVRLAARLQDNHVHVKGHPFVNKFFWGGAGLPLVFRMVEKAVLVDRVLDPSAAQGIQRWDEVLEVDGEPVHAALARMEPYVASANAWTRDLNLVMALGRGKEGTGVQLKVRGLDGQVRTVVLVRSGAFPPRARPRNPHQGDVIQILPGNIGYVDLDRLIPSQVEDLFAQVKNTRALIFDMRGYPKLTAWPIAPYLNVRKATTAAIFFPNEVSGESGDEVEVGTVWYPTRLPRSHGEPLYQGKCIMLVDETSLSQAEYTGQMFFEACHLAFVGSTTGGSNGDVTDILLPGGISITFTGQGVRFADGRQLQRVGIEPDVWVRPTVDGIRHGHDEVLERAIQLITDEPLP